MAFGQVNEHANAPHPLARLSLGRSRRARSSRRCRLPAFESPVNHISNSWHQSAATLLVGVEL
jgi:hypothetical protein